MEIDNGVLKHYGGSGERVVIPEGVWAIERFAFAKCETVERIDIPDSVTEIGPYALEHCVRLRQVSLPPTLTVIADGLFSGCGALEQVELPGGVTDIESFAFHDCASLREIRLSGVLEQIDSYAFSGCVSLREISFPETLCRIGDCAFQNCSALQALDLPDNVTFIHPYTFSNCIGLKRVRFRKAHRFHSIRSIGKFAFDDCKTLEYLEAPASLRQIAFRAFGGCTGLKTIRYDGSDYNAGQPCGPEPVREIIRSIGRPAKDKPKPFAPARPFPAGYPYMDEFEYLGRDDD